MKTVKTIGYEGASLGEFLQVLASEGVEVLVDVRAVAISRKKGFSKSALSISLAEHGISYVHLRGLGDPKEGREAARAGFMTDFRRIFAEHLATQVAQDELTALCEISEQRDVCLLCYEADPSSCHRTLIVEAMRGLFPVRVDHLRVSRGDAGVHRAGCHPGESRAAA